MEREVGADDNGHNQIMLLALISTDDDNVGDKMSGKGFI